MADKLTRSQNKSLLRELPFYGTHFVRDIQINSCTSNVLPTKKDLDIYSIYDLDLISLNTNNNINPDANLPFTQILSNYYSPHSFSKLKASKDIPEASLSFLHNNLRSLRRNIENFQEHLLQELNFTFSIIGVTETRITQSSCLDFNPNIVGYNFEYVPTPLSAGGVGLYIHDSLIIIEYLKRSLIKRFRLYGSK
jgi:hypothetical protein